MMVAVRNELFKSVDDYTKQKRTHWVVCHPGQCVLNGSQVMWTKEVETAFEDGVVGIKKVSLSYIYIIIKIYFS
jgi:dynein heavy chain